MSTADYNVQTQYTDTVTKYDTEGVQDPNNHRQLHRIDSILNARDFVLEQRNNALDKELYGEVSSSLADKMVRIAVEGYIYESETKIQEYLPKTNDFEYNDLSGESKAAVDTWYRIDLGTIDRNIGDYEFIGIQSYIDAPAKIMDTYVVDQTNPVNGQTQTKETVGYEIPRSISMSAYRALNYFWATLGMDVDMTDKRPIASYE